MVYKRKDLNQFSLPGSNSQERFCPVTQKNEKFMRKLSPWIAILKRAKLLSSDLNRGGQRSWPSGARDRDLEEAPRGSFTARPGVWADREKEILRCWTPALLLG